MTHSADIISLYERHAVDWDTDRGCLPAGGQPFEKTWLDRFCALLPPAGSILDTGCGSGDPIARYLIDEGFRVTGVDAAPSLIEICRGKFPDRTWIVADMRSLDLNDRFDGILAWHSLFHLTPEDQRAMFAIFQHHLHLGGVLMFTSGPDHGEVIGRWRGEPLYHGSLSAEEYTARLGEARLSVVDHVVSDPDCGHATVWLARNLG